MNRALLFLFFIYLLSGCSNTTIEQTLNNAGTVMDQSPDSARRLLETIEASGIHSKAINARYALLYTQALDKCEMLTGSDSLINIATSYFNESDPENAGYAWFYKARCAYKSGFAPERANALLKAEGFANTTTNNYLKALVYTEKALMYTEQKQPDSTIIYYRLSFGIFSKMNDKRNAILALLNIGNTFLNSKNHVDSTIIYFKKAEKLTLETNETILLSSVYRSLAAYYYHINHYDNALYYYKKVPLTGIDIYDSNLWYILAKIHLKTNQLANSKECLNKVKTLGSMAPDYYHTWEEIYIQEGNLKQALQFSNKEKTATDSIYKQNLTESFAGLEKKFRYQNLQIANQQLTISINRNRTIILLVLLMLSTVFIVFLWYRVRSKRLQIETQNKLLQKESDLLQKQTENYALLQKQIRLQENLLNRVEIYKNNLIKVHKTDSEQEDNQKQSNNLNHDILTLIDLEMPGYLTRLRARYPKLTQQDIALCCLLISGFESGMIATIFDVKIETINKQRYRLRSRLHMENSENLKEHLLKI